MPPSFLSRSSILSRAPPQPGSLTCIGTNQGGSIRETELSRPCHRRPHNAVAASKCITSSSVPVVGNRNADPAQGLDEQRPFPFALAHVVSTVRKTVSNKW